MNVKVIHSIHELINWFLPIVSKYPRNMRYSLGTRIEENLFNTLENCITAQYSKKKVYYLNRANMNIELCRHFIRISNAQKVISNRQYEAFSRQLNDIGKQVGGWKREREENA
jgi:hypothetical protein